MTSWNVAMGLSRLRWVKSRPRSLKYTLFCKCRWWEKWNVENGSQKYCKKKLTFQDVFFKGFVRIIHTYAGKARLLSCPRRLLSRPRCIFSNHFEVLKNVYHKIIRETQWWSPLGMHSSAIAPPQLGGRAMTKSTKIHRKSNRIHQKYRNTFYFCFFPSRNLSVVTWAQEDELFSNSLVTK